MKKCTALLLIAAILLTTACDQATNSNEQTEDTTPQTDSQIEITTETSQTTEIDHGGDTENKLTDSDVQIVQLPPMTVVSAYAVGNDCEGKAGKLINRFVEDSGLLEIYPDARFFGFDCSNGEIAVGENSRAYEMWVSIPEDMEVPESLEIKQFPGGLYGVFEIADGDFHYWESLFKWADSHEDYEVILNGEFLEEPFDDYSRFNLMIPIKER